MRRPSLRTVAPTRVVIALHNPGGDQHARKDNKSDVARQTIGKVRVGNAVVDRHTHPRAFRSVFAARVYVKKKGTDDRVRSPT